MPPTTSIQQALTVKSNPAGSGLGRHLIADFLHKVRIFPGTPSYVVCCTKPELFFHIRQELPAFMARFTTNEYHELVCSYRNSANPFAFNAVSNNNYIARYIDVFRRIKVWLKREDYNAYVMDGLLDKKHIIGNNYFLPSFLSFVAQFSTGEPYPQEKYKPQLLSDTPGKWVRVVFRGAPLKTYTVIRAQCPKEEGWKDGPEACQNLIFYTVLFHLSSIYRNMWTRTFLASAMLLPLAWHSFMSQ
jgi:hypothetical protein